MKFYIKHSMTGRLRVHMDMKHMSFKQADILEYYIKNIETVTSVKVYEKTCDAVIEFKGDKAQIINELKHFTYSQVAVPEDVLNSSGREMNSYYQDKLVNKVFLRAASKLFLPISVRNVVTTVKSVKYIGSGVKTLLKGKMEVPVLDATAIGVSMLRNDFNTAGSVMFLLGIGEIMEEWTHKKSVGDLARTMSLNVSKVWLKTADTEVLVPVNEIKNGDEIIVHVSNVIPFDGVVVTGEAMVNQASLTGEAVPVSKNTGSAVFAGTVIEEGGLTIKVKQSGGNSKYDKIVKMIEESEKLKSGLESKAEHLADSLVPYTLGGTALTYLLTRNVTKALSILMVDFSCALKLAMPITVLSAIRQAGQNDITVKGGKFLEAVAAADTIVFDKTGTLTKGVFEVTDVITANGFTKEDIIKSAAYAESYSSHPISKSIREAYGMEVETGQVTDIEEISGHGVKADIGGKEVLAGNLKLMNKYNIDSSAGKDSIENALGTLVYVAIGGIYAGCIVISDVIKPTSQQAIAALKKAGVKKVIMLTGDAKKVAEQVAGKLGVDEVKSELLPADKVIEVEKLLNSKGKDEMLAFVGDGINDAPVLSRADIGIAMGALGSDAAIEAADIVLMDDDPAKIATAMNISRKTLRIVHQNIVFALAIKIACLALGAAGVANMWMAIFADVGVMVLAVLNATRCLSYKD